uniref:Uncharacterized protein n=1 Tax=Anguilla anguilla TaxID=7936 RepID=A0A0E9SFI9_ANGAN
MFLTLNSFPPGLTFGEPIQVFYFLFFYNSYLN